METLGISRRALLATGLALPLTGLDRGAAADVPSLGEIAARKGLLYGSSLSTRSLDDRIYAETVAREAKIIVAEAEMKRSYLEPQRDVYSFSLADRVVSFANTHRQKIRGHTLVYHEANPKWLEAALSERADESILTNHIQRVVTRYKGQFQSWDVVNEAIEPLDGQQNGLRKSSVWFQAFGERYIPMAFHAARDADPTTPLFYNEINLEGDARWVERRKNATLGLLERLIASGVPLSGVGIQGHLKRYMVTYSQEVLSRFLDDIGSMGLKVMITEFDVADIKGPADPIQRDRDVADLTRSFLDVVVSKPHVVGCLTWGLTDKYSWLSMNPPYKWPNGELSRGLPYDADFKKKPMWSAMADSFKARQ